MLEAFRDGRDVYSEFASEVLGGSVRRPLDDDPPDLAHELRVKRQVGKQAVLGLGYYMGALRFMQTLQEDPNAAKLFDTGELTPLICRNIVKSYRSKYGKIPEFWAQLEEAARRALDGVDAEVGPLKFERNQDGTVLLWLPSGRALRYEDLRLDRTPRIIRFLDNFGDKSEFTPEKPSLEYGKDTVLYGGKLCENVVQATARDLLVTALLRLEESALPVLLHVHDEVVVEVPSDRAKSAYDDVHDKLSETPPWAKGLPVACEVSIVDRYGKG